jgi:FtsZ-binding cell division protein ZapB
MNSPDLSEDVTLLKNQDSLFQQEWLDIQRQRNALMREQNALMQQQNGILSRIGATIGKLNLIADFLTSAIIDKTICRFSYPLEKYLDFDWEVFGAEIIKTDRSGPAIIVWRDNTYTRRSNQKNGNDIWYSRLVGTTEGGKHIYDILIKFSGNYGKANSLPDELKDAVGIH